LAGQPAILLFDSLDEAVAIFVQCAQKRRVTVRGQKWLLAVAGERPPNDRV
jgi:hypothetical protein